MNDNFTISASVHPGLDERLYDTEFNPESIRSDFVECKESEFKDEIKIYRFLIYIAEDQTRTVYLDNALNICLLAFIFVLLVSLIFLLIFSHGGCLVMLVKKWQPAWELSASINFSNLRWPILMKIQLAFSQQDSLMILRKLKGRVLH